MWSRLNREICDCQLCPRLTEHCRKVAIEKRKAFQEEKYWGGPVPNFGRSKVPLLIVGLAPGAHGANRTGRMFTGDRSGDWLYRAMYGAGFCNQPESTDLKDGLKLQQCAITAVCHCAPPDNRPVAEEIANCRPFLEQTVSTCRPYVLLALGGLAWNQLLRLAIESGWLPPPRPKFQHGAIVDLDFGRKPMKLVGCYHPSQQNTFTGRLTREMLDSVFNQVRRLVNERGG